MASIHVVPVVNASGYFESPNVQIPSNAVSISLRLARCTTATPSVWSSLDTIVSFQSQWSIDDGQTWSTGPGFESEGGIKIGRRGEVPESVCRCAIPSGASRLIRAQVSVTGPALNTTLTISVD